ncbi:hypothetical protein [Streptomyces lacrimifluminis]
MRQERAHEDTSRVDTAHASWLTGRHGRW